MTHAEQLERETEQARAEIATTLDELRACMTPGHVLDQLADRIDGGTTAAFARNLRNQAVSNPLPVALISTGLAWLMLGHRGGAPAGTTSEAAAEAADTIHDKANAVTEGMQRTADATKAAGQRTLQSGSALVAFCREQPLVLAGLGIAIGAIIGALLPASDAENRLMGDSSDRLKQRARDLASQQQEAAEQNAANGTAQSSAPTFDTSQEEAAHPEIAHLASGERKAADAMEGPGKSTADEPTLAPKGPDETKGQPWSPENAPL